MRLIKKLFLQENSVIEIVEQTMPAVVAITISENLKRLEKVNIDAKSKKRLSQAADSSGLVQIGSGSGFIVEKTGVIVTNKHIISDPLASYSAITNIGEKFEVEILTRDPINDVAILKIKNENRKFPVLKLGNSSKINLGETVLAFGNAMGIFRNTVSKGIISGLSRNIAAKIDFNSKPQELRGLIQTDAAINPGNSGGPLVNLDGEALGINTVAVYGAENIGLALPINSVKKDLEDLKKYGKIKRPLLGVRYLIINDEIQNRYGLSVNYGALVVKQNHHDFAVIPESPADICGIKENDIILEINGEQLNQEKNIGDFLENFSVGDILKIKLLRGKKELLIKLTLSERK